MASADKLRQDRTASKELTRSRKRTRSRPKGAVPARRTEDAIGGLLGTTVIPRSEQPARAYWYYGRWMLGLAVIVALAIPIIHYLRYQSAYVTSKNAAVRGHLAEIGSRLTGRVADVLVDVGDQVASGQLLVRLEDGHLMAEVQEARAEIEGLQRALEIERLEIENERLRIRQQAVEAEAKVAAAQAQTDAAEARASDALADYQLRERLFAEDGVVSSEEVREAQTRRATADARLDEARANSRAAVSTGQSVKLEENALAIRERKLGVLEADLLRARARLTRAEADLEGAAIRAPEDGAIVRRIIQPGGSIQAGQPIISMWLGSDIWVEAWVDEDDIGAIQLGSVATVTFHSLPGREFRATVDKIGLATDLEIPDTEVPQPRGARMSGAPVVGVRVRLDEPPSELLPGLSAVVAIQRTE